jgi:hypothetical protein
MDSNLQLAMPTLHDLSAALLNLRQAWPQHWPGMPLVFDSACQQLGLDSSRKGSAARRWLDFGRAVSERVEQDGAWRHAQGQEPAYHNRLHIADTLVCMTYLLKTSAALNVPGANQPAVMAMALSIMVGHDFLHPGGTNGQPGEFEARAVEDLQPLMADAGLSLAERQTVAQAIMATDPVRVKGMHLQVRTQPYDLRQTDCLIVLLQEADITGSTLPQTAPRLSQSLSTEWSAHNPKAAEALLFPQNRMLFLVHGALFSSPAAGQLGLDAVKLEEVKRIEDKLKAQSEANQAG